MVAMTVIGRRVASFVICVVFGLSIALAESHSGATSPVFKPNPISPLSSGNEMVAQEIVLPKIFLVRQDGSKAMLPEEFEQGKPVLLTFIFSSCKAICPIMSRLMKSVQNNLGGRANEIQMASISLDPEFDTPKRLTQYAHQLGAGTQWTHYTGLSADIVKLERAFTIYRGDKMNHLSVFFVRRSPKEQWLKFTGFVNPDNLIKELGLEHEAQSKN